MAFKIINTREQRGYVHDGARPFLVLEVYCRGYRSGMATVVMANGITVRVLDQIAVPFGRYATLANAKRAIARRGGTLIEEKPK
jgi:hypothetical protein